MVILAGDIGGTKTVLAIFDGTRCVIQKRFDSTAYATFEQLLAAFLLFCPTVSIDGVCIGVAGPIVAGDCQTTNLPWQLSCAQIRQQVNTSRVILLNDLEAAAWGVLALPEDAFASLNPNASPRVGNCAVIAAGTGLGEAIIFHDGTQHHVIATEGGHSDFAPSDAQQIALFSFMQTQFPEHVSYERLVSGVGIEAIYAFLTQTSELECTLTLDGVEDMAAEISRAAIASQSPRCVETMRLFCRIYGAEAGNLALKCLPYGGVYITGGIALKCLPLLQQGDFLAGFLAKGRYRSALENMAVNVCLEPDVVLLGALSFINHPCTLPAGGFLPEKNHS